MKNLRGNISVDTSILIEYLTGTEAGEAVKKCFKTLKPEETANCSILTAPEIRQRTFKLRKVTHADARSKGFTSLLKLGTKPLFSKKMLTNLVVAYLLWLTCFLSS